MARSFGTIQQDILKVLSLEVRPEEFVNEPYEEELQFFFEECFGRLVGTLRSGLVVDDGFFLRYEPIVRVASLNRSYLEKDRTAVYRAFRKLELLGYIKIHKVIPEYDYNNNHGRIRYYKKKDGTYSKSYEPSIYKTFTFKIRNPDSIWNCLYNRWEKFDSLRFKEYNSTINLMHRKYSIKEYKLQPNDRYCTEITKDIFENELERIIKNIESKED